jgi:Arc/MetJ-type ribon-helix-helix transcriptional regulator
MGELRRIEVSVSEELAAKLDAVINAGDYSDPADLVSDMLDRWYAPENEDPERLRRLWEEGLASGDPIEGGFDPEDIRKRGLERLKALQFRG